MAVKILQEKGVEVVFKEVIKDGIYFVKESYKKALRKDVDIIIYIGGTGISKTDMTADALENIVEKNLPGFGELFRMLTYEEAGTISIMSRALMGIRDNRIIVALPGSPKAVRLALEKILLSEINHIYKLITEDRH